MSTTVNTRTTSLVRNAYIQPHPPGLISYHRCNEIKMEASLCGDANGSTATGRRGVAKQEQKLRKELFPRKDEYKQLIQAYEKRHACHLIFSVGPMGIGKSLIIDECLRQRVHDDGGCFVQVSFDHLECPSPYGPWIHTTTQLLSFVMNRCDDDELKVVLQSIEANMDARELAALSALIPLLREIMKNNSSLVPWISQEQVGENIRFNFILVFGSFLRGLMASTFMADRPVVWFLDSVQQADDASSLQVLKLLVADAKLRNVLPVLAFRPTAPDHPVSILLQELEASEAKLIPIILSKLTESSIADWLATRSEPIFDDPKNSTCSKIVSSSMGNPLAVQISLAFLKWNTDFAADASIEGLFRTLVQLLPETARQICMTAACMGDVINLPFLEKVVGDQDEVREALNVAQKYGLLKYVVPTPDAGCGNSRGDIEDNNIKNGSYAFINSCYREMMYSVIDPTDRMKHHYSISKVFRQEQFEVEIFRLVVHMALAGELLSSNEKQEMVAHCLQAGQVASRWQNFVLSEKYLKLGFAFLLECPPRFFKTEATLVNNLFCLMAEVMTFLEKYDEMEEFIDEALLQAGLPEQRLNIARVQMQALIAQHSFSEAISIGKNALQRDGENFKKSVSYETELKNVQSLVASSVAMSDLGIMQDRKAVATMGVMGLLMICALSQEATLVPLLAFRMTKLTYKEGFLSSWSPFALSILGGCLCLSKAGDVHLGSLWSQQALQLVEESGSDRLSRGRTMMAHWGIVSRFQHSWNVCHDPLKTAYRNCMRGGDREVATLCPVLSILNMFAAGIDELQTISDTMKSVHALLHRRKHDTLQRILRPFYQITLHLRGVSSEMDPTVLTGTIMKEDEDVQYITLHPNTTIECALLWCRAFMCFHLHNFSKARRLLDRCQSILRQSPQILLAPTQIMMEYVSATTSTRLLWGYKRRQDSLLPEEKRREAALKESFQDSLKVLNMLSEHCADNVEPYVLMLKGEWHSLQSRIDVARDCFRQAIDLCEASRILACKAVFCEQAGLTLRVCSEEDHALDYLEDCCASYRAFGANLKVDHVKSSVLPDATYEWNDLEDSAEK